MTNLTSLYKLPSPELLVGSADGPAAIQALAARTERELPQLRRQDNWYADIALLVGAGQQGVALSQDVTVAAIGWLEVDASLDISVDSGVTTGGAVAGFMNIRFGATITRPVRFHNHSLSVMMHPRGSAALALVSGQTTVSVDVLLALDSTASQPIRGWTVNLGVRQYGAPATG